MSLLKETIDSRVNQIERIWGMEMGEGNWDYRSFFKAMDLAKQEKWSNLIFYLFWITLVPAVSTIPFNPALGVALTGTTMAVGGIGWTRRQNAIDAVNQEKLARQ